MMNELATRSLACPIFDSQTTAEHTSFPLWGWHYLSASSSMTILCRPGGSVTFFCANILILFRTTSRPLQMHGSAIIQPIHRATRHQYNIKSRWQQPVVRGVELEHALAIAGPEHLVGQRQDARRLPSPRRPLRRKEIGEEETV